MIGLLKMDKISYKRKGEKKMKIKFWIDADDEVIELDDDVTEEDIEMEFESWFNGCVSCGWYIEEDD